METENYYKIDSLGKAELHFEKKVYDALPQSLRNDIKRFFNWSRSRSAWVSKGQFNSYSVIRIIEDLNKSGVTAEPISLAGKDDALSFTDRIDRKLGNAERRAESLEARAEKQNSIAERLRAEVKQYNDYSFWTQPLHLHSAAGRSFANFRQRLVDKYEKSIRGAMYADQLRERAESVKSALNQSQLQDAGYLARRIKEANESLAKLSAWVPTLVQEAAAGGNEEECIKAQAYMDKLELAAQKLYYFTELYDALDVYTADSLQGAVYVKAKNTWHRLIKTNPKTVTVSWFVGTWKVNYPSITDAIYKPELYDITEYPHCLGCYSITLKNQ